MNRPANRKSANHVHASWDGLMNLMAVRPRENLSWQSIDLLKQLATAAYKSVQDDYKSLRHDWNIRLRHLCGSSTQFNWNEFRPLRLSREEDWSDWLAWLLQTSETGLLAECMFGGHTRWSAADFVTPKVKREISTEDGERRADLIISCKGLRHINVEVKLWDSDLGKTFDTFQKLRTEFGGICYGAILIPSASIDDWQVVAHEHAQEDVGVVFWDDVVIGLRRSLWEAKESIVWQAWGWTFCCAVETELLTLRAPDESNSSVSELDKIARWIDIFTSGKGPIV